MILQASLMNRPGSAGGCFAQAALPWPIALLRHGGGFLLLRA
jgi:hypothetical protein